MTSDRVHGKSILVFGDLHLSSTYEGQHKDYMLECYETLSRISEIVSSEKPDGVIFTGDIIGVNERNIRSRQFLMHVIQFFESLNKSTRGKVFTVKGNHDIGDFTDFDFLIGLGLLKNPNYVDLLVGEEKHHEIRFHLVNYGKEDNNLPIVGKEDFVSNVVIGHNNYYIDGVTGWYGNKGMVEVGKLTNMSGIDYIVSGHIHSPESEILYTTIQETGKGIGVYYPGSPSRTAERYEDCYYVKFTVYSEEGTTGYYSNMEACEFGLKPVSEAFYPAENFIQEEDEDEVASKERSQKLTDFVKEVIASRITSGDFFKQIDSTPNATEEVKKIAKTYLLAAKE